ncbi:TSUP family transporter, partial [Pseudomonas aeruginosa]
RLFRRPPQGGATPRYGLPWMGVLGLGAGSLGGLFGVGGGVLATPVLTSVFGLAQVVAQGLALALAAPSTAVALGTYAMRSCGLADGDPLALGGLLSISWGVRLAHALPERSLRMAFCAFLALCAVLLLVRGWSGTGSPRRCIRRASR